MSKVFLSLLSLRQLRVLGEERGNTYTVVLSLSTRYLGKFSTANSSGPANYTTSVPHLPFPHHSLGCQQPLPDLALMFVSDCDLGGIQVEHFMC